MTTATLMRPTTPPKVRVAVLEARQRIQTKARLRARWETVEFQKINDEYAKALHVEFLRQYRATMKFLNGKNAFKEIYADAQEQHAKAEKFFEKVSQRDLDNINRYFAGWADHVNPEKMEKVMHQYNERAANLGGKRGLDKLGIKVGFNLKDPQVLKELKKRGVKITGEVSKKTLNDLRKKFGKMYDDVGFNVMKLKGEIKNMFKKTYKNRAKTIARTESGIAQMTVQNETFKQNDCRRKVWQTFVDERTRESHIFIDGEQVAFNEPFSNGLMYPLDGAGPAEEIVNCRCDYSAFGNPPGATQAWNGEDFVDI